MRSREPNRHRKTYKSTNNIQSLLETQNPANWVPFKTPEISAENSNLGLLGASLQTLAPKKTAQDTYSGSMSNHLHRRHEVSIRQDRGKDSSSHGNSLGPVLSCVHENDLVNRARLGQNPPGRATASQNFVHGRWFVIQSRTTLNGAA